MNRQIKRAIGSAAALSLGLAGLVGIAAPAQAADPSTYFKVHLNVPKSVAQDWNIWYWGTGNANVDSEGTNGTIGTSTRGGITLDASPNFIGEDAYGAFAEFTLPATLTGLNNVIRTTESWDGQEASPAVDAVAAVDEIEGVPEDPNTPEIEFVAAVPAVPASPAIPAKPAIPASDKPMGNDFILPAGESWWDVNLGKRVTPETVSYKVHVNMPLKTAVAQGWNIYTWGTTVKKPLLANYEVSTTKVVTSRVKVKGKYVTVKRNVTTKTKPYAGKIPSTPGDANEAWPFVGEDKYGAYAIVKTMRVYSGATGLILRRSSAVSAWKSGANTEHGVQTTDFGNNNGTGLPLVGSDVYLSVGSAETYKTVPAFVGRYGATATYADGKLTVTPVRPSHVSLQGMFPTKIVVTAKRGANATATCTIQSKATATVHADASWALPESCEMTIAAPTTGSHTWEVFVQAEAIGVGKALLGPTPAKKVTITAPVVVPPVN
jgi:hypothetical protein